MKEGSVPGWLLTLAFQINQVWNFAYEASCPAIRIDSPGFCLDARDALLLMMRDFRPNPLRIGNLVKERRGLSLLKTGGIFRH